MAGDRVELNLSFVGNGLQSTPEKIEQMQRRQQELERLQRPKTTAEFAKVLGEKSGAIPRILSKKEQKLRSLPKRGPKPGLVHPGQREVYSRDEQCENTIVLKG